MNDQEIENEIQAKGLNAPRVTPAEIEAEIASEHYFTGRDAAVGQHETEGGVMSIALAAAVSEPAEMYPYYFDHAICEP